MTCDHRVRNEGADENSFRWAVGIEGSCIPHLSIDEYEWTQHDTNWREDFQKAAKDLNCRWMRYSLAWHLIETSPGVYDWTWADERIHYARGLGLNLILDLVHFGTPTWLPDAFGDVEFPSALERFSREFGKRYSGIVRSVCPINEPLITAFFCGDAGIWPPHGRSLASYMTILSRVAQALTRSIRALRNTMSSVEIVLCDALESTTAGTDAPVASPELVTLMENDIVLRNNRRHVVLDLITGRIAQDHTLYSWLEKHGFPKADINWFLRNPVEIDVLGLDYYKHSEIELYPCGDKYRQRVPTSLSGLDKIVRDYWERYHLPMMVTETNCYGNDDERRAWLAFTLKDIRKLRAEGIRVIGYTWWPLLDHLDWDGALLHRIGRIHHVGMYRLERREHGILARVKTPLADDYHDIIQRGTEAVGDLIEKPNTQKTEQNMSQRKIKDRIQLDHPIIVHCHLRWDGVWQRPQQFLSRLSENHKILFVEGPIVVPENITPSYELQQAERHSNVTIMRTYFPASRFHDGAWVDNERLRLLEEALQNELSSLFECPVQWFYDPMAVFFADKLNCRAVVYDCMDQLSQFKFAPPELVNRERRLLEAADVVFAGGRKLWEAKSKQNQNCHFYGCGVDVSHFSKARLAETIVPHDVNFIHRPMLGYFGVVDERLDYELINKLALSNPDWSIVIVGPLAKVDPNSLPCTVNLYWLGRREYATLPAYTKAFDVCLMPFALNEATEYINPTKALEYMATGTPIVSTAVPDVVSNFGDVVKIAKNADEFMQFCQDALKSPDQGAIERGLKMAGENSWESIVANLERHVGDALSAKVLNRHPQQTEIALSVA
ncbi:MAG: glycosyltransferase [Verrucomicrobiales bacterium]|nr:glycosyltransferase [Verrucomicrobiales bacterium]